MKKLAALTAAVFASVSMGAFALAPAKPAEPAKPAAAATPAVPSAKAEAPAKAEVKKAYPPKAAQNHPKKTVGNTKTAAKKAPAKQAAPKV